MTWRFYVGVAAAVASFGLGVAATRLGSNATPGRNRTNTPQTTAAPAPRPAVDWYTSGTGVVAGQVSDAMSQPVPYVSVSLSAEGYAVPVTQTADQNGRFRFGRLAGGRYVVAAKGAVLPEVAFGQNGSFGLARPITLDSGAVVDDANIRLQSSAVVVVNAVDVAGRPLVSATASIWRRVFLNGALSLSPGGPTCQTDDLGSCRLFAIPAGNYFVAVSAPGRFGEIGSERVSKYPLTYFPGTPDLASARSVSLRPGGPTSVRIPVSLQPVRLVVGKVFDSLGRPGSSGFVRISDPALSAAPAQTVAIRSDGTFAAEVFAAKAHDYEFRAVIGRDPGRSAAPMEFAWKAERLDGDAGTLVIRTQPAGSLTGRVVFEGGQPPPAPIRVIAVSTAAHQDWPTNLAAVVRTDGTFEIPNVVWPSLVQADVSPSSGWYLANESINGSPADARGFLVSPAASSGPVVLQFKRIASQIAGAVTDGIRPDPSATVIVFSAREETWTDPMMRFVKAVRTDANGIYDVAMLPLGAYWLTAVSEQDIGHVTSPDRLRSLRSIAQKVTIDGDHKLKVDLTVRR